MKNKILFFLTLLSFSPKVFAGAWTLKKNEGEIIQTLRLQPTNTRTQFEYNPYLHWGLLDGITIGGNGGYRLTTSKQTSATTGSVGYAEVFARFRLLDGPAGIASFQAQAGSAARGLGANSNESAASAEARLLWGLGTRRGSLGSFYFDVEAAYRDFFGKIGNELRSDFNIGWKFAPGWIFLSQLFVTKNLRSNFTPQDYDSTQVQLSIVAPISRNWHVQAGIAKNIAGKQIDYAPIYFLGLWFNWGSNGRSSARGGNRVTPRKNLSSEKTETPLKTAPQIH